jgi:hypothetical protein
MRLSRYPVQCQRNRLYYVKVFRHLLSTTMLTGFAGGTNCSVLGIVHRHEERMRSEK